MRTEKEELRGRYILNALEHFCKSGDAYIAAQDLYGLCRHERGGLAYDAFRGDLAFLLREGHLHQEGRRIYLHHIWRFEEVAATALAGILQNNDLCPPALPETVTVGGVTLTAEQTDAVRLALSHRLSIIAGGAGTGKTTLIRALVECRPDLSRGFLLCAPTGKAAQNLEDRTAYETRTVHGVLGKGPDDKSLSPVYWPFTELVVVDEAGMLTLELLAGLLHAVSSRCRLVLVGDPGQLQAVGPGNVLPDLMALGVPCAQLDTCHRQDAGAGALVHNVRHFKDIRTFDDLRFDASMRFIPQANDVQTHELVCRLAAERYRDGESIQVLAPVNRSGELSVRSLNRTLQNRLNPATVGNTHPDYPKLPFRDGDRVMVLENDWEQAVCNGDVGVFHFLPREELAYCVMLEDGWTAVWSGTDALKNLSLAYAITIHKSQGSEYDTVILPMSKRYGRMLSRNLIYTAVSRAKKQVILVGDPDAVEQALRREAPERRSMLVVKTHQAQRNCA